MLSVPPFIKVILLLIPLLFSLTLISCSSQDDYPISAPSYVYNSDNIITIQETVLPMDVTLQLEKSVYFEVCDIRLEFYDVYYQSYDNNRVVILIDDYYGRKTIEYDTKDGMHTYFAENGKNFVFYFKKFHLTDNSCEIVFTLNQYGLLK